MIEVKNSNLDQSALTEKEVKVSNKVTRKTFAKSRFDYYPLPNLVAIQTDSYEWFLKEGFKEVLKESSPITDSTGNLTLEYVDFAFNKKEPKFSMEQSKDRDLNFSAPMRIKARLTNKETGEVKESETFLCDFPIMTDTGTFVINGAERVVVSQIVRSPGMYYDYETDKLGKKVYSAQIIPYRGAWLEYEVDAAGFMYVRIDKNRKVPFTMLLHALGLETRDDIYAMFGNEDRITLTFDKDETEVLADVTKDTNVVAALKEIYRKVRPGEPATEEAARTQLHNFFFDSRRYDLQPVGRYKFDRKAALHIRVVGKVASRDVVSPMTGEIVCEKGTYITRELGHEIEHACVNEMYVFGDDNKEVKVIGNNTVAPKYFFGFDLDCVKEKARIPVMQEIADACEGDVDKIQKMAKERFYDLCPRCLTYDDIFASISYQIDLMHGVGTKDDIDHLGNRRIRAVGEQLQNQIRIGFSRMDKIIRERMETQEEDKLTIQHLINIRPITSAIREFFGSSQLSQFMDQNNPLAELTHKRRISALGQGGLSRDRASIDVRDIHYTQYGRICPVETPEGPNIGLITYMASYAKINPYGFMMAPYRKVVHEKLADGTIKHYVSQEVEYITADEEDKYICAQANEPLTEDGEFVNRKVIARDKTEVVEVTLDKVDYMDVAPKMLVSVAANMIPFLENDDNTRALMGSNMQKQAVPLMTTDSPIVGTGMEYKAAYDSGVVVKADRDGVVARVQANEIVIETENGERDVYELLKFRRTNQGTCFDQRPIVKKGDVIKAGDVIADGPATYNGEISLGKNALVGFMTWEGYNYEDAVLLNEKLVRDDTYTSLHIEEHTIEATVTKIGPEELTNEIPNVSTDMLKHLNPDGIIQIGTEVHSGDILVGKITPKGETELTPEEKLLRAIFGKNSNEVRDTSLKLAHGESGVVVDVKVFSTENGDDLEPNVKKKVKVYVAQKRKISLGDKMAGRHGNKGVVSRILPPEDMPFLPDGTPLDIVLNPLGVPSRMNIGQVLEVHLGIAARKLGWKIMTPVFDGANEKDIMRWMKAAALERDMFPLENPEGKDLYEVVSDENGKKTLRMLTPEERANETYWKQLQAEKRLKIIDGKIALRDGRTGETFNNPVTVGIMYYLKLHHLVEDKIHARSTGPYSLITQQPLGGKAQFGGQRFGEMEVWALEAYGAAYTLQEILTVKSDDINGRRRAYEAIIKGENIPTPGVPESFKVMVRELQSLCLDVRVQDREGNDIDLAKLCTENETPLFKFGRKKKDLEDKEYLENAVGTTEKEIDTDSFRTGTASELRLDEMAYNVKQSSFDDFDLPEEEEVYDENEGNDDASDDN